MASSFLIFLDHTQRRITVGRIPLGEWSARRRDLYLSTLTTDVHPCHRWVSNPQSQQASGRRTTPLIARTLGWAHVRVGSKFCPSFINNSLKRSFTQFLILIYRYILLTAIGSTPGDNSTVHIYTQTIHGTTQLTTLAAVGFLGFEPRMIKLKLTMN